MTNLQLSDLQSEIMDHSYLVDAICDALTKYCNLDPEQFGRIFYLLEILWTEQIKLANRIGSLVESNQLKFTFKQNLGVNHGIAVNFQTRI